MRPSVCEVLQQTTCYRSCRTWDDEPYGDTAVSVGIGGHAVVLPGILSLHPADLQGRVRQQLHPPRAGPDGTTRSVPGQVVAHGAFHLAGQYSHASHRGSHIYCGLQDRRRLCFSLETQPKHQTGVISTEFTLNPCVAFGSI